MIRPQRWLNIRGTAALAIKNVPLTLVSIIICQAVGFVSQNGVGSVMKRSLMYFIPRPALLTSTSRRPNWATVAATTRWQSSGWVTSAASARTRESLNSLATSSTSVFSRAAVTTTLHPARASPRAIARPSPRPPPVTMATVPSSDPDALDTFTCGPSLGYLNCDAKSTLLKELAIYVIVTRLQRSSLLYHYS